MGWCCIVEARSPASQVLNVRETRPFLPWSSGERYRICSAFDRVKADNSKSDKFLSAFNTELLSLCHKYKGQGGRMKRRGADAVMEVGETWGEAKRR